MTNIVDRRKNTSGKSTGNRQRFIKRMEGHIRRALPNVISDGSIRDMGKKGGTIKVPIKGVNEPEFVYERESGKKETVRPGNDKFNPGDRVKKTKKNGGGSKGSKGSKDMEPTEDAFTIILTKDEFLKYFFEDLELPNMVKVFLDKLKRVKFKRAGYSSDGNPSKLNIVKSFTKSLGRRTGVSAVLKKKIEKLEEELKSAKDEDKKEIEAKIEKVKKQLKTIPFLDTVDLKYNNFNPQPTPSSKAVMFCIMDVSASMSKHHKSMAKRFYTLLYLFLMKAYEDVDVIFIRHHTEPKEVTEQEFFEGRETGGTMVAPALELTSKIIDERYSEGWNVYCCQASDGDVWGTADAVESRKIIRNKLLDKLQYMAYVEISEDAGDSNTDLWDAYKELPQFVDNFQMTKLWQPREIWPVFKKLFKKKVK